MIDERKEKVIDKFLFRHGYRKSTGGTMNLIYIKDTKYTNESKMIYIEPTRNTFRLVTISSIGITDRITIEDTTQYTCRQLLKRIIPYL